MSSRVRPASAIASRHASSVRSSGLRNRRRPTSDWPMPEMIALRSPNSISWLPSLGGLEERKPHVFVVVEHDAHRKTDVHVVGFAADDARRETQPDLLLQLDDGDDVRRVEARDPRLV